MECQAADNSPIVSINSNSSINNTSDNLIKSGYQVKKFKHNVKHNAQTIRLVKIGSSYQTYDSTEICKIILTKKQEATKKNKH